MALREMMASHSAMVEGNKRPAVWLVSPAALTKLKTEAVYVTDRLAGVPIRVVEQWTFGFMLLDQTRAKLKGITDLE